MPIKKIYYIEWRMPCKYEPLGFHESIPDSYRQEYYVTSYKKFISNMVESIKKEYNLNIYYSKTESDQLYLALNVYYRYHYIIALVDLKIGILKLNHKPDTNLIKLIYPNIHKDCRIVSRYELV